MSDGAGTSDPVQYSVVPIGRVVSDLKDPAEAPRQGDEGAPAAWIELVPTAAVGLEGLRVDSAVIIVTWLDRADRATLRVHPRDDPAREARGVFTTRSADRPNPVGLHPARVVAINGHRLRVDRMEAVDGTPVIDIKPVLGAIDDR